MNIGVIGVGGVGGYFGGKLTTLLRQSLWPDLKIYFLARNQHLQAIKKNGLLLTTVDEGEIICHPSLATDQVNEIPILDLCLLCVKSYDLKKVLVALQKKITQHTIIIPLLNGVDIYERIRTVIPHGQVYPACAYVGTHIEKAGQVVQNGGSCTILFGRDPVQAETVPQIIFDLFEAASIKYNYCEDPYPEIWKKYIFIAAYGMVTASENKTLGQALESEEARKMVQGIMNEIVGIAAQQGIHLPDRIVAESLHKAGDFPYATKTSLQRDFEQLQKADERELYGATILRLGEHTGVETPCTHQIYEKLNHMKRLTQ